MPKISALTLGATIDGANDLFAFVDVSDVTQAPTGTTKKAVINSIPTQNIYNTSSSLTGSRVVTLSGNALEFREGTALLSLDAGNFGVVVGTGTATASAVFEVSSTTKGVLVPRMTTAQKNAITTPATSLLIFDTDNNQYEFNSGTPAAPVWSALGGGGGGIYGGDGNLPAGETNVTMGANTLSFDFADATTAGKIVLKDGGTEWARIRQLDTTFEHHVQFSSVGVETENRGALLQLRSTTQALLLMRMTTTERNNIPTPAAGMIIFNTTTNQTEQYVTTTGWTGMGGGADTGNILDTDALTLATTKTHKLTNARSLIFTNSDVVPDEIFRIESVTGTNTGKVGINQNVPLANLDIHGSSANPVTRWRNVSTHTWIHVDQTNAANLAYIALDNSDNATSFIAMMGSTWARVYERKKLNIYTSGGATDDGINIGAKNSATNLALHVGNVGGGMTAATEKLVVSNLQIDNKVLTLFPAATTGGASIRIPHGSDPTSPVNGDIWTTTAGLFVRINGVTVGPLT